MFTQIQLRHDIATAWVNANPILAQGEIGIEIDTRKQKIGNGTTPWMLLDYSSVPVVGSGGVIESQYLPSYVDDVVNGYYLTGVFYSDSGHTTTITGEVSKIYVDITDGKTNQYRWSGSAYIFLGTGSLATDTTDGLMSADDKVQVGKYRVYDTVMEMQADSANITVGMTIQLLGYYSKNGGAGHKRKIKNTDDGSGIAVGGLWANYLSEDGKIHALHFGLNGNNTFDNTTLDQKMHTYTQIYGYYNTIVYSYGNFKTDYIPTNHVNYEFNYANRINFTDGLKTPSYSDKIERLINNQEYAFAWLKAINSNYPSTKKQIIFAGDSTSSGIWQKGMGYVNNGYGKITDLFIESCKNNGIGFVDVVNGAWSGTNASDWATDPEPPSVKPYVEEHIDAYPNMNCYVVRYGLNDAIEGTIEDFRNRMEIGLNKLRTFKSVEHLTIVLMTPNSSFQGKKNEKWIESITPIIKFLAKKYQCVYIDTYGSLKDVRSGYNIWNDYIHPDIVHMGIINSLLEEVLIKPLAYSKKITNNFRNIPKTEEFILVEKNDFDLGMTINRAEISLGFPREGQVITFKHADGVLFQINSAFASEGISMRNGVDGGSWQDWENVGGGSSETTGVPTASAGFTIGTSRTTKNNSVVLLDGYIIKSTPAIVNTGTELFTLAMGFRPRDSMYTTAICWDGGNLFEVIPISIGKGDGKVYIQQTTIRTVSRIYLSSNYPNV